MLRHREVSWLCAITVESSFQTYLGLRSLYTSWSGKVLLGRGEKIKSSPFISSRSLFLKNLSLAIQTSHSLCFINWCFWFWNRSLYHARTGWWAERHSLALWNVESCGGKMLYRENVLFFFMHWLLSSLIFLKQIFHYYDGNTELSKLWER